MNVIFTANLNHSFLLGLPYEKDKRLLMHCRMFGV